MSEIGEVSKILKEKECEVEWKVDLHSLLRRKDEYYLSPSFFFEGEFWWLAVWSRPDSSIDLSKDKEDTLGYIDLCLYRKSSNPPTIIEFHFSLKTLNGWKILERHKTENFTDEKRSHCIHRFLSISELVKRKCEFENSGFVTFVCTLKKLNFTEYQSKFYLTEKVV